MKSSKPVSFPTRAHQLFIRKFWTNRSCCLLAQFVLETVGVAPLPSRLWFLSYPDTMNHFSSAHLLWTVCYDIINPETLNNTLIDELGGMLCYSPRLRSVLAFILYSQAPKFSSLIRLGAVALADYSCHWLWVCSFVFQKVKVKFYCIASFATARQNIFCTVFLLPDCLACSFGWGGALGRGGVTAELSQFMLVTQ